MPRLVSSGAFLIPQRKSDADCAGSSTTGVAGAFADDFVDGPAGVTVLGELAGALARWDFAALSAAEFSSVTTAPESGVDTARA